MKTWTFSCFQTYHAIEKTATQNTGKPLYILDGITPSLPILRCIAVSMLWYKIVINIQNETKLKTDKVEKCQCHLVKKSQALRA